MALKVGGFNEFNPSDQIVFDNIIAIIEKNYKSFGYTHISTPAVEKNSVLLSKSGDEVAKQIFGVYGLAQGKDDTKDYSLRFDLTIPFARYVLDWQNELVFPFKRYQIQPVRRGERQQRGRFKEFIQTDIDTIRRCQDNQDYSYYDAETIFVLYKTLNQVLKYLGLNFDTKLHINNKKIINALVNYAVNGNYELKRQVFTFIDKYYKIAYDEFEKGLYNLGISDERVKFLIHFLTKKVSYDDLQGLVADFDDSEFDLGVRQLKNVLNILERLGKTFGITVNYQIDFFIVRGLDYYTGTVFETYFENDRSIGSVCSGGRYDGLTTSIDSKTNFCGVGGSIGVYRLMSLYQEQNIKSKNSCVEYLFVNFEETFDNILSLASRFIETGKNIEIYPSPVKLKKQFEYADKKGVLNVVILGLDELKRGVYIVKNMKTGQQDEYDLA